MKIGSLDLENNVWMAPLCGITDRAFRTILREHGAGLTHTEMVSCAAIVRDSLKTLRLMELDPGEGPVCIQLFGEHPDEMAEAARFVVAQGAAAVGINFGCPVPKVVKHNGGSALLKDPQAVGRLTRAVVKAASVPVIPKIRTGWDEKNINALEIARIVEDCGAAALVVHGRTRSQRFMGKADWNLIAQVKKAVKIPVIGNGDLMSPEAVKAALEGSGVDGVMIARGAVGNPWLISRTLAYLNSGILPAEPGAKERVATLKRHVQLMFQHKGEAGILQARKYAPGYLKGLPFSSDLRQLLNRFKGLAEVEEALDAYALGNPEYPLTGKAGEDGGKTLIRAAA